MRRLEELAAISVGRGCGFAALGIGTLMLGLSGDLPNALKAGGILSLLATAILLLKAIHAPNNPYKRTELWVMLEPEDRPPAAVAQGLVGSTLRRAYLRFALHYAAAAITLLFASMIFATFRLDA